MYPQHEMQHVVVVHVVWFSNAGLDVDYVDGGALVRQAGKIIYLKCKKSVYFEYDFSVHTRVLDFVA